MDIMKKIQGLFKKTQWLAVVAIVVVALLVVVILVTSNNEPDPVVITSSALEKIINVSELSTFTAVYNGVSTVMDDKKTDKVDYYVYYEARVDAGVDMEKVAVFVDNEAQTINVDIPEIHITNTNVDISSFDFIFVDDKANKSTITEKALKACENDVRTESGKQKAIYELAEQNAKNVLRALINPIIEQSGTEYTLIID